MARHFNDKGVAWDEPDGGDPDVGGKPLCCPKCAEPFARGEFGVGTEISFKCRGKKCEAYLRLEVDEEGHEVVTAEEWKAIKCQNCKFILAIGIMEWGTRVAFKCPKCYKKTQFTLMK